MTQKQFIEPFARYRLGVPWLSTETNPKTMNVDWHAGSLGDLFKEALDRDAMYAELMEIWRRPRDRRGSFSHGRIGGRMAHVPHEIGRAVAEVVRRHFVVALDAMTPDELHNRRKTK